CSQASRRRLCFPTRRSCDLLIGGVIYYEDTICRPDVDWVVLHEYQKHRVCTLLDPSADPLGRGFHTIQSMMAIGSGGIYGEGYLDRKSTRLHSSHVKISYAV